MSNLHPDKLPPDLSRLRHLLVDYFDLSEIRTLCLDLGVRYDDLGGEGITAKVRELLLQLDRSKRIEALLQRVESLRPKVDWRGGPLPETVCPYKGLHAFGEADKDNFFGRDAFTQKLVDAVHKRSLVAVVGPSGSGKSSVVLAGLLPTLHRKETWLILHLRPGNDPFLALAKALVPVLDPDVKKIDIPRIARRDLKPDLGGENKAERIPLADYFQQIQEDNPDSKLLLIVDQFEELYTQVDEAVRRDFLDVLLAAGFGLPALESSTQSFATLLLTMRADFMGQALAYPPMVAALQDNDVKIGLMSHEELRLAIEQPALNQGVRFADGLVTRILEDVGDHAGNLPLLEFALTLLWDRQTNREMTHEAYETIGGVSGALAQHADETLAKLTQNDAEKVQAIQRVMVQLVQPGAGAEDTRRVARRADLGDAGWTLAQRLAAEDARLLVTGRDNDEADTTETVEVIHEALIQNWGQLQVWMETDREFRMWQERLRSDLKLWGKNEKREGFLLQGAPLTVAADWLQKRGDELQEAKEELAFIEASVQRQQKLNEADEARRQRELDNEKKASNRLRQIVIGLFAGLVIVTVLGVLLFGSNQTAQNNEATAVAALETSDANAAALVEAVETSEAETERAEEQARLASARALAAEANQWLGAGSVNKGLVNAYQAMRITYDSDNIVAAEAHAALVEAIGQVRPRNILEGHSAAVSSAMFNPDGTNIVTASADGTARLWDSEGIFLTILEGHSDVVNLAIFNHDGTRILTASSDFTARLWDAEGALITVLEGHTAPVLSALFNHDGTRIVTASDDGTARLWDDKGNLLTSLEGHSGRVNSAVFNPEGTFILTAGTDGTSKLWDRDGNFIQDLHTQTRWINSAIFNHDGTRILTADGTGEKCCPNPRLWNEEGDLLNILEGHTSNIKTAVFNHDGTHILTASEDATVRLWDGLGNPISVLKGHTHNVLSAIFNHDGTRILTASSDFTARLWDAEGTLITVLEGHTAPVVSAVFNHDGTRIVTASSDGTARLWNTEGDLLTIPAGQPALVHTMIFNYDSTRILTAGNNDKTPRLWDAEGNLITELEGHLTNINSAVFNHDGTRILTASGNINTGVDNTARLWDEEGKLIAILEGHTALVYSAVFNHDGTRILTTSADGTAMLWDGEGNHISTLKSHTLEVLSAEFSPDGAHVIATGPNGIVLLWDTVKNLTTRLGGHADRVVSTVFNHNGTRILTASGNIHTDPTFRLWDGKGNLLAVLEGHTGYVVSVVFNHDGTRILTVSSDNIPRLWDAEGKLIAMLRGHSSIIRTAMFNHDGTRILTAGGDFNTGVDNTARLWTEEGNLIAILEGHTTPIMSALFNHDSTRILTIGSDARLWDEEGNPITVLDHTASVYSAVFNHDGTRILIASDTKVRLWRVFTKYEEMLAEAERKLQLVLTSGECEQYFAEFDPAFCEGWGSRR